MYGDQRVKTSNVECEQYGVLEKWLEARAVKMEKFRGQEN